MMDFRADAHSDDVDRNERSVVLQEPHELSRVHSGLTLTLLGREPSLFESFCTILV